MKPFSVTEVLTAIVAIYAAVLSTIIFFKEQNRQKRQVQIVLTSGYLGGDSSFRELMLFFKISNPGFKDVTLYQPSLLLPDGGEINLFNTGGEVNFPHTLIEGKVFHTWCPYDQLKQELVTQGYSKMVKIKAKIQDQTGKQFKSKKFMNINLNEV
jgi:hypothetical protein